MNPLTKKRLFRFIRHRRAFISFLILAAVYAASLGSELLCNGKPLAVYFKGRLYFPFIKYYSEDNFYGNGIGTAPDYREMQEKEKDCTMLWAPVQSGPNDIVTEKELEKHLRMTCRIEPEQKTAVVTINPDRTVRRIQNSNALGRENGQPPQKIDELWALPQKTIEAIEARFANRAALPLREKVKGKNGTADAELSIPEFKQRRAAPKYVRVTARVSSGDTFNAKWFIGKNGLPADEKQAEMLDGEAKKIIMDLYAEASSGGSARGNIIIEGRQYTAFMEKESVRFPFRPVKGHILGIDDAGRDVLARLVYSVRTSITFGLILVICSMLTGTVIGLTQGYLGGWADLAGQRLIEIWSALPFLYVIILLGSIYGPGFMLLLFCNAIFNWIGISYYMRAEMLRLKKQPFVDAAKCLGLPAYRIVFRHILPNAMVPIITFFPFSLVGAIGSLAALDYLGFGLPLQSPSIGQLLQQAQTQRWAWWLILYPSLTLFSLMLLGVFIGEGTRDAFDPKGK